MKAERLFRALGLVDPALVEEAVEPRQRKPAWKRWGALAAACLTLIAGFGWFMTRASLGSGGYSGGDTGSAGASGGGVEDRITFMSYAGPVLPLTTLESPAGLTAKREVTWDFAPGAYKDGTPRQWGAAVTDAYVLTNDTDTDITLTALYPFAGNFNDLSAVLPQVTADGAAAETTLYAGAYSGGFGSTIGADIADTMNLDSLDSWTEYKALLETGEYLRQAMEEYPVLDIPVTVYEFSDFDAPHEQYRAATQAISFHMDQENTQIFTYGFNGMDWDGDFRRYSYFVPDGVRNEPDLKVLVVLGEDIGDYALQGYQDGGCERGEEIEGVSCTVTRSRATFDAVLDQLCLYYQERYIQGRAIDQGNAFDTVPYGMYRRAVSELLRQYGALSGTPMDRYSDGRLDDILSEVLTHERVLYLGFPVTVSAGESLRVECAFWKMPSFDYACSGSEHVGLQGYDLVTRLGSPLEFTSQRAALVNTEGVELAGQNFGFDPENGVTSVDLDLDQEHYRMEV